MEETQERKEKLEISKGAQIAAKWWAEQLDGTIAIPSYLEEAEEMKKEAEEDGDEIWAKLMDAYLKAATIVENQEKYISQEQSQKLRKNLEILLQKSINERGHEWLATDEDHACGYLGLACYFSGIDHENLPALPLNVMMHVWADKVEIDYQDFMRHEVLYDAKQEAILHADKQTEAKSL